MFTDSVLTLRVVLDILSSVVGLTFGYGMVTKLFGYSAVIAEINAAIRMPHRLAGPAVVLLMACEGVIALSHLSGVGSRLIIPSTLLLLGTLFCGVAIIVFRGYRLPCFCFGASRDDKTDGHTLMRLALLLLCEIVLFRYLISNARVNPGRGDSGVFYEIALLTTGAMVVSLVSWGLSIARLRRAWKVLDA